jgi:hypothetical protein
MNARGVDFSGIFYLAAFATVGVVAWYVFANRKAIVASINPADANNLANRGASAALQSVTGDRGITPGTGFFEFFNRGRVAAEKRAIYGPPAAPAPLKQTQPTWDQQLRGRVNDGSRVDLPMMPAYIGGGV